jgi:glycosyltransferase involved in cell wall biosynthesis
VTWEQGKLLYNQADMFTQHAMVGESTGQVEAFGVSILEAMASALPVSTCKIGGIAETVIENETGLFFEPENIEQQADTFIQLANNEELRTLLGNNARQRVIKYFSLETEAKNLLDILKQGK